MFLFLFLFHLYSTPPCDFLKSGSLSEGQSSSYIVTRPDLGEPENIEEAHFGALVYWQNPTSFENAHRLFGGPAEDMQVVDIDGNGLDDVVFVVRDDESNPSFNQLFAPMVSPILPGQSFVNYPLFQAHFSLRQPRILHVDDFDASGGFDFLVAKIESDQLKYQLLLNPNVSENQTVHTPIHSLPVPFLVQDTHLVKHIDNEVSDSFLYLQGEHQSAFYVYDVDNQAFGFVEYLVLPSDVFIQKVQPIQRTHESFIVNFNVVIHYNDKISFVLYTTSGMTHFKNVEMKVPNSVLGGNYILDEIYVPEKFENRVAVWYQSESNSTGQLIFFKVTENEDHISFVQEPDSHIQSLYLDHKPKFLTYLPSYVSLDQSVQGHSGQWAIVNYAYNAPTYDDLIVYSQYQSNS